MPRGRCSCVSVRHGLAAGVRHRGATNETPRARGCAARDCSRESRLHSTMRCGAPVPSAQVQHGARLASQYIKLSNVKRLFLSCLYTITVSDGICAPV